MKVQTTARLGMLLSGLFVIVWPFALTSCSKLSQTDFSRLGQSATSISGVPSVSGGALGNIDVATAADAGMELTKAALLSDEETSALSRQVVSYQDQTSRVAPAGGKQAKRLALLTQRHTQEDGLSLNFRAYDSPQVNAMAFADGSVRVYSGLMELLRDEELLGVLGHEIGHAKLGHSARQLRVAYAASGVRKAAASSNTIGGALAASELGGMAESLVQAQYSQSQEKEADSYGLQFLARHGYDPRGAVKALNKLAALENTQGGGSASDWFSSHPAAAERAERLAGEIEQLKREVPGSIAAKGGDRSEPSGPSAIETDEPSPSTAVRVATLSRTTNNDVSPIEPPTTRDANRSAVTRERSSPRGSAVNEEPIPPGWYVQVSAETDSAAAAGILQQLKGLGFTGQVQRAIVGATRYNRVVVGPFAGRKNAMEAKSRVQPHNLGNGEPFLKQVR